MWHGRFLRSPRLLTLTFFWGWVVGPALAILISRVLPMSESYATGLIIFSLAPCAPFLPMVVRIARADMNFAAAVVPLISVGTVVFIPLLVPLC